MENISSVKSDDGLIIKLTGHIDSTNAGAVEEELNRIRAREQSDSIIVDCEDLEYLSSAGLRIILRLKKSIADLSLVNVSSDVYDVFEMTGFTEMIDIQKAYRKISVEGCEVIGQGANGKIYRIGPDTIVKVFLNPDSLAEIKRERELARAAFVLGIPTAIPYDVVRIDGGGYGSVFELLDAKSFANLLISGEKTVDELAQMSIDLLKQIHSTTVKPDTMPDMKAIALDWGDFLKDYLPEEAWNKLHELIDAVPEDDHMLHGDYHLKNVMLQNGECLLIDMDTLCHGHPIFELASMFNAYRGYSETNHQQTMDFLGIDYDTAGQFWTKSLSIYLGTDDPAKLREVEDKARVVGYTRIMRRRIRRNGFDSEEGRKEIENCKTQLLDLLPRIDSLLF
ncbi:MAG: anti-sigma factor antagonist [Oscillospiraceae bacterium]|nr:anti-sigma factor antagonist [Oscillospiraceae bacterium]